MAYWPTAFWGPAWSPSQYSVVEMLSRRDSPLGDVHRVNMFCDEDCDSDGDDDADDTVQQLSTHEGRGTAVTITASPRVACR